MEAGTLPPGSPASHVAAQISATAGAGRGDTERVREGRAGGAGRGGTWGAGSPASPYPSARGAGRVRTAGRRRRRRGRWLGAGLLKDVFGESAGRKSGRQDSGAGESQGTILGTQRLGAIWMQPPSSLPPSFSAFLHNLSTRLWAPAHARSAGPPGGIGRAWFTTGHLAACSAHRRCSANISSMSQCVELGHQKKGSKT